MDRPAPYATYLEDIDILYVQLRDGPIARSGDLDLYRNVDFDADGRLVAVEFVNAADGIRLDDVPEREEVERLMREAGIRLVPVLRPVYV